MTAPDLSAIIASIGGDVRFRESRTMLGGHQWTCIIPCGRKTFFASGQTPVEAAVAAKLIVDAFEGEDLTEELEASIAAVQAAKNGCRDARFAAKFAAERVESVEAAKGGAR